MLSQRSQNRSHSRYTQHEQGGSGLFGDMVRQAYTQYTSPLGTMVRNAIPASDVNARPGFPGEKHGILKLPNGTYGVANYLGPGTHLVERLKRGDPPRTLVDKTAKAHDIRYFQSQDVDDIRRADVKMMQSLADIQMRGADSVWNINQGKLIGAKMVGEDLGLLKRDAFSGDFKANASTVQENKALFDSNLQALEQEGYGMLLPGDMLKMQMLKELSRQKPSGKRKRQPPPSPDEAVRHLLQTLNLPAVITGLDYKTPHTLAKTLLPHLVRLKLGGRGKALPPHVKKHIQKNKNVLESMLQHDLKQFMTGRRRKQQGGTGFWRGFKTGFTGVMKPATSLLGAAALASGQPEFGVPLLAANKLM